MSFAFISGDPYNTSDATPKAKAGGIYYHAGDASHALGTKWRYVKSTDALVAGDCVFWDDNVDGFTVTRLAATGLVGTPLGSVVRPCGVAQGTIDAGEWGYVLVAGKGQVRGDGSVVAGDYLVVDGGTTPVRNADTAGAGEEHGVFGQALDADTGSPALCNAILWIA